MTLLYNATSRTQAVAGQYEGFRDYQSHFLLALALVVVLYGFLRNDEAKKLPIINPQKWFQLTASESIMSFAVAGRELLEEARQRFGATPFRVLTDQGKFIMLLPQHGEEIRNDPRFSVDEPIIELFQARYPGFEPFMEGAIPTKPLQNVVKLRVTKSLAKVTQPLSDECAVTLQEFLGDTKESQEIVLRDLIIRLISRMSARVFVGENLCRNERWLDLVVNYGENSVLGMRKLRLWPSFLKTMVTNYIPECRDLKAQVKEAWDLVAAELKARHAENDGKEYNDTIYWFEELAAGKPYNFGASQLMLAVVSIGTTSDLITQALVDIFQHPELIEPLREEITACLEKEGWKKTALYNMKLLDSVLNESQRLKPNQISSMFRQATADVTLSDGTKIPKGHTVAVSTERMRDPAFYENPNEFDGYRFLRMRESGKPGQEAAAQLVTTSVNHLGFGHGEHGCPGRFFAASEAKIIIAHLLLKYDWKYDNSYKIKLRKHGFAEEADPDLKVYCKRREVEVPL
ncbi:cytochrome P450 [Colletotrichum acutatum]|uniref:Cytochrome P450 n=1 Tax=Glomerella acutata TaxID=27357 RepID=A0AAD9CZU3_GLOAC|nr:cytochrome P450 [Colletotrichum acutatum]KAK1729025.1 cytochrome P450 [Colletotrichum acutatum]